MPDDPIPSTDPQPAPLAPPVPADNPPQVPDGFVEDSSTAVPSGFVPEDEAPKQVPPGFSQDTATPTGTGTLDKVEDAVNRASIWGIKTFGKALDPFYQREQDMRDFLTLMTGGDEALVNKTFPKLPGEAIVDAAEAAPVNPNFNDYQGDPSKATPLAPGVGFAVGEGRAAANTLGFAGGAALGAPVAPETLGASSLGAGVLGSIAGGDAYDTLLSRGAAYDIPGFKDIQDNLAAQGKTHVPGVGDLTPEQIGGILPILPMALRTGLNARSQFLDDVAAGKTPQLAAAKLALQGTTAAVGAGASSAAIQEATTGHVDPQQTAIDTLLGVATSMPEGKALPLFPSDRLEDQVDIDNMKRTYGPGSGNSPQATPELAFNQNVRNDLRSRLPSLPPGPESPDFEVLDPEEEASAPEAAPKSPVTLDVQGEEVSATTPTVDSDGFRLHNGVFFSPALSQPLADPDDDAAHVVASHLAEGIRSNGMTGQRIDAIHDANSPLVVFTQSDDPNTMYLNAAHAPDMAALDDYDRQMFFDRAADEEGKHQATDQAAQALYPGIPTEDTLAKAYDEFTPEQQQTIATAYGSQIGEAWNRTGGGQPSPRLKADMAMEGIRMILQQRGGAPTTEQMQPELGHSLEHLQPFVQGPVSSAPVLSSILDHAQTLDNSRRQGQVPFRERYPNLQRRLQGPRPLVHAGSETEGDAAPSPDEGSATPTVNDSGVQANDRSGAGTNDGGSGEQPLSVSDSGESGRPAELPEEEQPADLLRGLSQGVPLQVRRTADGTTGIVRFIPANGGSYKLVSGTGKSKLAETFPTPEAAAQRLKELGFDHQQVGEDKKVDEAAESAKKEQKERETLAKQEAAFAEDEIKRPTRIEVFHGPDSPALEPIRQANLKYWINHDSLKRELMAQGLELYSDYGNFSLSGIQTKSQPEDKVTGADGNTAVVRVRKEFPFQSDRYKELPPSILNKADHVIQDSWRLNDNYDNRDATAITTLPYQLPAPLEHLEGYRMIKLYKEPGWGKPTEAKHNWDQSPDFEGHANVAVFPDENGNRYLIAFEVQPAQMSSLDPVESTRRLAKMIKAYGDHLGLPVVVADAPTAVNVYGRGEITKTFATAYGAKGPVVKGFNQAYGVRNQVAPVPIKLDKLWMPTSGLPETEKPNFTGRLMPSQHLPGKPNLWNPNFVRNALSQRGSSEMAQRQQQQGQYGASAKQILARAKAVAKAKMDDYFKLALTPNGPLPRSVFDAWHDTQAQKAAINQQATNLLRDVKQGIREVHGKRTPFGIDLAKEMGVVNDALQGKIQLLPTSPLYALVKRMRTFIDSLSDELIRSGAVDSKLIPHIDANKGFYLNRSYQAFDDPNWYKKWEKVVGPQTATRAKSTVASWVMDDWASQPQRWAIAKKAYMADKQARFNALPDVAAKLTFVQNEGLPTKFTIDDQDNVTQDLQQRAANWTATPEGQLAVQAAINSLVRRDPNGQLGLFSSGKLGSKNLSILQKRKEIPNDVRQMMGEYKRADINFPRSVSKMASLWQHHQFLKQVRAIGLNKFMFQKRQGDYFTPIAAHGSKTFAPLNGMYTTPEIAAAFSTFNSPKDLAWWARSLQMFNMLSKAGVTVLNPSSIGHNLVSQTSSWLLNGHWMAFNPANWRMPISALAQREGWDGINNFLRVPKDVARAYLDRMIGLGVIEHGPWSGDLHETLQDTLRKGETLEGLYGIPGMVKRGFEGSTKTHEIPNSITKILQFESERRRYAKYLPNATSSQLDQMAAKAVQMTTPTYSEVPNIVRAARRAPLVGPFMSFASEVWRNYYNTLKLIATEAKDPLLRGIAMKNRIPGALFYMSLLASLSAASKLLLNIDSNDEKRFRKFLPEWSRNSELMWLGNDGKGKLQYLDMSYLSHSSLLVNPLQAILDGKDWEDSLKQSVSEVGKPFLDPQMGSEAAMEAWLNAHRTASGDLKPVSTAPEGSIQQLGERTAHALMPAMPGVVTAAGRMVAASQGKETSYGQVRTVPDEVVRDLGFNVTTLDLQQSLKYAAMGYQQRMDQAESRYRSVLLRNGPVDNTELTNAQRDMEATRQSEFSKMSDLLSTAQNLGVGNSKIIDALVDSKLGRSDIRSLMSQRYAPYTPGRAVMKEVETNSKQNSASSPPKIPAGFQEEK